MSGPTTIAFSFAPFGAVLLAAEAIREMRAMGQEYSQALENIKARENKLAAARRDQREALAQRRAAVHTEAERQERRLARLKDICAAFGERAPQVDTLNIRAPSRPADEEHDALMQYAAALHEEVARVQAWLEKTSAALGEKAARVTPAQDAPALDEMLNTYAVQRALLPGLSPLQADCFRETAARILDRLELDTDAVVPRELEDLAREIMLSPSLERAEKLASELRLRVQLYQQEQALRQQDAVTAQNLLEALQDDIPADLREALLTAASGMERLDPATRLSAERLLAAVEELRAKREQEAAAVVLEQSLRDLGYEVDSVENTLFVEGGVIHFQRPGWEDYFVRLRLDPKESTLNVNVVRPRSGEESEARKRLDVLAEDRWCSELPHLLKTLAARGLELKITRHLGAGELPVQVVDPASLPQTRTEEERSHATAPLQRSTPPWI
jgi:hypothetical protein